jgi:hypothetical protein
VRIDSAVELILGRGQGEPENEVDSCFKNYYFMGHGRLDFVLGSFSVPGIDFSSHNPSENIGTVFTNFPYLGLETLSKLEEFWANNNQLSDWKEVSGFQVRRFLN